MPGPGELGADRRERVGPEAGEDGQSGIGAHEGRGEDHGPRLTVREPLRPRQKLQHERTAGSQQPGLLGGAGRNQRGRCLLHGRPDPRIEFRGVGAALHS
ncbi:hypothetical protein [Streptomyces torulosus]|uniref:hypothetical protein n=1 Tax=Streptomyces torulosus TaxID=68276 RepID=UPI0012FE9558